MKALRAASALVACLGCSWSIGQNAASGNAAAGPPAARDMVLVGYHDLQARSAYQPVVREQNGRWIAYIGHH
jgi:hypothetical protein